MKSKVFKLAWKIYRQFNNKLSHAEKLSQALAKAWRMVKAEINAEKNLGGMVKKYMESKGCSNIADDYKGISATFVQRVLYRDYKSGNVEGKTIDGTYDAKTKTIEIATRIVVMLDAEEKQTACSSLEEVPMLVKKALGGMVYRISNFAAIA